MTNIDTTEGGTELRSQVWKHEDFVQWATDEGFMPENASPAQAIAVFAAKRVAYRQTDRYRGLVDTHRNSKAEQAEARAAERAQAKEAKAAEAEEAKAAKAAEREAARAEKAAAKATASTEATPAPAKAAAVKKTAPAKATKKAVAADPFS